MPRGRPTRLTVRLTPQERLTLQAWQRATTMPAGRVRRGRIILLLAEGRSIREVARLVGSARRFVDKCVARFQAHGVEGLLDRPHPGPWATRRQREAAP